MSTPVASTAAAPVPLVLHTPPGAVLYIVVVAPAQRDAAPLIVPASGSPVTVTTELALAMPQLLDTRYTIFAIPAPMPATFPEASTVAIAAASVLHSPSLTVLLSAVDVPAQRLAAAVIVPASGSAFTVATAVAVVEPHSLPAV